MTKHSVLVSIDQAFEGRVDAARLARVARLALAGEGAPACELSVAVTDDETVRRLNRDYAGDDHTTDVLSFSQREGEEMPGPPGSPPPLGEVIISYEQAERQAPGDVSEELDRLLIHGVLHLLGHDHAEEDEAARMRAREEALLAEAGNG